MLQQAHLSTAASSFNTLHLHPIGPKKASLLNSSSWLAGIVCTSNPWSLRQSSIRSSCRRCFCSCTVPSIYIEAALLFLLHIHPFVFRFWQPSGSWGATALTLLTLPQRTPSILDCTCLRLSYFPGLTSSPQRDITPEACHTRGRWGTAYRMVSWISAIHAFITSLGEGLCHKDFQEPSAPGRSPYLLNAVWRYAVWNT